ncbi:MAG: hypothetical protein ACE5FT_03620 [Candidatus Nanoarchaeia archaeon]
MDNRGVSPLVATLILIALSALLGAVVMSWGKAYIEERAEFVQGVQAPMLGCENVVLNFIRVGGKPQVCVSPDSNSLRLFVEAGPRGKVPGAQVRVVGSGDIYTDDNALKSLPQGQSRRMELNYGQIGDVRQVKVTPYAGEGARRQYCNPLTLDAPIQVCG